MQKMLEGNPGKRPIEIIDFMSGDGLEQPSESLRLIKLFAEICSKTQVLKNIGISLVKKKS